ncbi:MAG: rhodanese-like domain-containing protein [Candidatus Woesearchaeota archaeon]
MEFILVEEVTSKHAILDVRSHEEYDEESIPGSQHIPLNYLSGRKQEIPENPVLVCRTDNRSAQARNILGRGRVLKGGITAWKQAGKKTE